MQSFLQYLSGRVQGQKKIIESVHNRALKYLMLFIRMLRRTQTRQKWHYTVEDAYRINRKGKIVAFIGMENGYPVGNDIWQSRSNIYDLGARYITLSHSSNNDICDSSTDSNGPEYNGFLNLGKR